MEIISNTRDPIKIGFPTNSRMAEDCAPLKDALELEGPEGVLRSRYLPNVIVRTARVNDIARLVRGSTFVAGIIGDDTAVEFDLEGSRGVRRSVPPNFQKPLATVGSDARILRFEALPATTLTLFARQEENAIRKQKEGRAQKLLTAYPILAAKCLPYFSEPQPLFYGDNGRSFTIRMNPEVVDYRFELDASIEGQIESFVRNGDIPGIAGGIDLVRSGKTMREFRLEPIARLLESKPGLWANENIPAAKINQVANVFAVLKERLAPFITR